MSDKISVLHGDNLSSCCVCKLCIAEDKLESFFIQTLTELTDYTTVTAISLPFIIIVLQTEVCLSGGDLVSVVSDLPGPEPLHGAQHPPHPAQQVQAGQDGHTQPDSSQ